jgi:hypothetical protein
VSSEARSGDSRDLGLMGHAVQVSCGAPIPPAASGSGLPEMPAELGKGLHTDEYELGDSVARSSEI